MVRTVKLPYLSSEWNHMMLTQGEHLDILYNNQFIVVFVENSPIYQVSHVLFIALSEKEHSFGVPLRGLSEALSLWILANAFENGPHSPCKFLYSLLSLLWCGFKSRSRSGTYSKLLVPTWHKQQSHTNKASSIRQNQWVE